MKPEVALDAERNVVDMSKKGLGKLY